MSISRISIDSAAQTILIVGGAGSRIGRGLIGTFAADGHTVIQTVHNSIRGKKPNSRVFSYRMDATRPSEVRVTLGRIWKRHGKIDAVVYNAGVLEDVPIATMTPAQWRRVLSVNLDGLYYVCKYASARMAGSRGGSIINIASVLGVRGAKYQANYAASKGGCIAFTKSLAMEMAPFNIRVNAVCPGFIPSKLNGHSRRKTVAAKANSCLDIQNNLPDLVNFVHFLASEKMKSVTGQVFHIDSRI